VFVQSRLALVLVAGLAALEPAGPVHPLAAAAPAAKATPTLRPVLRGRDYAVASMQSEATLVAERVLRAGGNAFDAIVAGQAVLGLIQPASNGVGGDAMLLVYDARTGQVWSINAAGTAPRLATIAWYREHMQGRIPVNDTLLSGTTPGVVDAWYLLLDRWGTRSFAEVLAPAIELAERGFPLTASVAGGIADSKTLRTYPASARVYYPGGRTLGEGEMLRLPAMARTLRRLVEAEAEALPRGRHAALRAARDRFYKGDIAREMAAFSEANGGLFRYEDFARYEAKVETPVSIDYRGYQVYKNPSANQGPTELFALGILEGYDLAGLGHNSAAAIHASVEAMKLAFADRERYLADADFVPIPYAGLLSRDYAAARRKLIDPERASRELRPGAARAVAPAGDVPERPVGSNLGGHGDHEGDTSYITVVDAARNAISFTPSLHMGFGTTMVMGDLGFSFNCRGDYFELEPAHANALEPGKRPRTTVQSTLVTKGGKLWMVTGSPGGDDQCMRTLQTLVNVVDYGMNIQQAIEAPRWTTRSFPGSPFPHTMYPGEMGVEERIPEAVRAALVSKGHVLKVRGPWSMGYNAGIVVDPATGILSAGTDPRCDAFAVAW
jgi:gamma-glutamyltranspeptidase/glutathione hydrolase